VIEDFECFPQRNITKDQLMEIADCSFIRRAENLLIAGLTGCGKSYPVPVAKRCDYIDEPTLADAIMNRLVENVFHIELKGESMRCRKKK
jgi:DNA replication protein DnaC